MNINPNVLKNLPSSVQDVIFKYEQINEIRLTGNSPLCLTVGNKNLITDCMVSQNDLEQCINNFCKNSIHTYFDSIKRGFIPYDYGYRIGVCGNAITDNGIIRNISKITGLNIRIPNTEYTIPTELLKIASTVKGLLVYSPVNTGKTTFLKALIGYLSTPPNNKRLSVIDCKNELSNFNTINAPVDYFVGYPKYEAMNMALQNMSPDVIVCDEIGLCDDVLPFIECANCGVDVICSAHASDKNQLLARKNIRELVESGIFEGYVGIKFSGGKRHFEFKKSGDFLL